MSYMLISLISLQCPKLKVIHMINLSVTLISAPKALWHHHIASFSKPRH